MCPPRLPLEVNILLKAFVVLRRSELIGLLGDWKATVLPPEPVTSLEFVKIESEVISVTTDNSNLNAIWRCGRIGRAKNFNTAQTSARLSGR